MAGKHMPSGRKKEKKPTWKNTIKELDYFGAEISLKSMEFFRICIFHELFKDPFIYAWTKHVCNGDISNSKVSNGA